MDILFYILCAIVGIFITYIFGIQFYKLGQNLKNRFPIIYRLYVIFWSIIAAIVLVGMLAGVKSSIDSYQEEKKREDISRILLLNTTKEVNGEVLTLRQIIKKVKNELHQSGASEEDAYRYASTKSKIFSDNIKKAKEKGYTDRDIADAMGLYLSYGYEGE